jgi:hypothetical protein
VSLAHPANTCELCEQVVQVSTYDNNTLSPSTCPLTANEANPVSVSKQARSNWHSRIQLDTHAEVEFKTRSGKLQGSSNLAFVEPVQKIVRRNGVFNDVEISRALLKMLALSACILRSNLVAVNALYRKTLQFRSAQCFLKSFAGSHDILCPPLSHGTQQKLHVHRPEVGQGGLSLGQTWASLVAWALL